MARILAVCLSVSINVNIEAPKEKKTLHATTHLAARNNFLELKAATFPQTHSHRLMSVGAQRN